MAWSDPERCRNCGEPTGPRFCGHCGQAVERGRRTAWALLRELAVEWFSLEGRLFRTLGALRRPGRLTLLYLDGKRAPYLTPMRLYLLASLVLFSSVLALRAPDLDKINLSVRGETIHQAGEEEGGARVNMNLLTPGAAERYGLSEQVERLRNTPPQQVLDTLFAGLRRVLPAALILCLPLLALVLKLLYVRTGTLYADHLVFAVHFQSALFVALALVWLLTLPLGAGASAAIYALGLLSMFALYLPRAQRRVYGQGRWRTAAKTMLLAVGYAGLFLLATGMSYLWAMGRL